MCNDKLKNINIREKYADVLDKYNCIISKEVFHKYNKDVPKFGDFIKVSESENYCISEIIDDGESYLIKWD